jgi:hypothetical protein
MLIYSAIQPGTPPGDIAALKGQADRIAVTSRAFRRSSARSRATHPADQADLALPEQR